MAGYQTELPTPTPNPEPERDPAEVLSLNEIRLQGTEIARALQKPGVNTPQAIGRLDQLFVMAAGLDPLVDKVANNRLFHSRLEEEVYRARRTGSPLSLLVLDLDNFGPLNNILGHNEGDEVLKRVGSELRRHVKKTDTVGRTGGDEFAILMPETSAIHGLVVAERILRSIPDLTPPASPDKLIPKLAASIGLAQLTPGEEAKDFFIRVDKGGLLAAKQQEGKNTIGLVIRKGQTFSIAELRSQILGDDKIRSDHQADLIDQVLNRTIFLIHK